MNTETLFREYIQDATNRFLKMNKIEWWNTDIRSFATMLVVDAMDAPIPSEPFWKSLFVKK